MARLWNFQEPGRLSGYLRRLKFSKQGFVESGISCSFFMQVPACKFASVSPPVASLSFGIGCAPFEAIGFGAAVKRGAKITITIFVEFMNSTHALASSHLMTTKYLGESRDFLLISSTPTATAQFHLSYDNEFMI
jgi:hypothetical protein